MAALKLQLKAAEEERAKPLEEAERREREIKERAAERSSAKNIQRVLSEMRDRNEQLEGELEALRGAPSSPSKAKPSASAPLSPVFNDALTKSHDACLASLNAMKENISEELTPSKKRKAAATHTVVDGRRKDALLAKMEGQVDALLEELVGVKEKLEEREVRTSVSERALGAACEGV